MAQYVYTMNRVGKIVPPKRGKSTLLKIMAGLDTEIDGEARPMPDIKVGYLPQEPELDPEKTVREIVEESVDDLKSTQARLDEVYAAYAEPDADFDALAAEQAKLEAVLQASDGHNLERQLPVVKNVVWHCAAYYWPHRTCYF